MAIPLNGNEEIRINVHSAGIGGRSSRSGDISCQKANAGKYIEVSIGRGTAYSGSYATGHKKAAWANLTYDKAHELACVLMHLISKEFPCQGEGPKITGNHTAQVDLSFHIEVDLCTVLNDKVGLKERILKKAADTFDKMTFIPKETPND